MGNNIVYEGKAGFGQHTKAANQIAVAGATAAYTEAIAYAEKTGLDPKKMLAAIGGGAAGMLAAHSAVCAGASVLLIERNEKLGRKLYITGKAGAI